MSGFACFSADLRVLGDLDMKVSSASTLTPGPPIRPIAPSFMASRMRWVMNQAVLYVTPKVRAIWCELMPFLLEHSRNVAIHHLVSGILERSKTVPTVTVNWPLQSLQYSRPGRCDCFSPATRTTCSVAPQ